ncbi:MAG TPA: histone deacetylase [Gemmatimonadaceae bacterium]|nr:histone deacetylase [Gemmatimonadaceae bacterium]
MTLHCWTSARYTVPLPAHHRFPIAKYALLRDAVIATGLVPPAHIHEPDRAPVELLRLVHTDRYIEAVRSGTLSEAEQRRIGLPWSESLVERSFRAVGGTLEAARAALDRGLTMNLAGGTHHAFPDHGEGFCVFNDVAVAIRALQRDGRIRRAVVLDLDVHQGNGTHAIFTGDPSVFTFSMHGGRNYPFHKVAGSLDVELADGTGDDAYLTALAAALPGVLSVSAPDLAIYLAGADSHEGDRLGRLCLTFEGLARRDVMVLDACREVGIPVVITIAGGYGRNIEDSVRVHLNTVRIASQY